MSLIKFDTQGLAELMKELEAAKSYQPNFDDLYNPEYYPGSVVVDENGQEVIPGDFSRFPSHTKMDMTRIEPAFWLVGDHGVYLMPNCETKIPKGERRPVVYAKGCNPSRDSEWYENKLALFGGDDDSIKIPVAWIKAVLDEDIDEFMISLKSDKISLLT